MQYYGGCVESDRSLGPKGTRKHQKPMEVALASQDSLRKRKAGRSKAVPQKTITTDSIDHHKVEKIEGRPKVCRQCVQVGRMTPKGYQVETSYRCSFCQVPLCWPKNGCFRDYHR